MMQGARLRWRTSALARPNTINQQQLHKLRSNGIISLSTTYLRRHQSTTTSSRAVRILEVGPRDGLQNIKQTIPTATKVEFIQRLAATGLQAIEATSFVSPKWIPQLADGAEVMRHILPLVRRGDGDAGGGRGIDFPVLVPNAKGLELAVQSQAREVVVFASATETFSMKNTNCSVAEALERARSVAVEALSRGIRVRGVVSCIFSDPYEGPTDPKKVLHVVQQLLDMGCYEVGLGDTLGVGTPRDTQTLLEVLLREIPAEKLAGHFHDTYGQAVANVVRAYDMGIRTFDSSIAGLGGCPYAKGAKGNLATEDIVYTFEKSGVSTGVDLDKLVSVGDWISGQLGIPNGSRAGSALVSKRAPLTTSTEKSITASTSPTPAASTSPSKRTWTQINDTGDFTVSRSSSNNIVKITLTSPQKGNALSTSLVTNLIKLFQTLATDPSAFHILLTSTGRFFCTGMDLSSNGSTSSADMSRYCALVSTLFSVIESAPQTTIAAVDNPAFGGGVGLAFACDVRLASPKAKFTLSEIKLGLSPAIISKYLIREWGVSFLREAMLSGRTVTARELKQVGAVHGIAEEDVPGALDELVEDYLDKLAQCAPRSAAACKELTRLGWMNPGGEKQEDLIKKTFELMLEPGSEGRHGIEMFQKKIRGIDWGRFWAGRAKL